MLRLPNPCPIDHYLDPAKLEGSPYAHRERSFFSNARTPPTLLRTRRVVRVVVDGGEGGGDGGRESKGGGGGNGSALALPAAPSAALLRRLLGSVSARVIHFEDVTHAFGGFDSAEDAHKWHEDAQALLSTWCCTSEPAFKPLAGVVPYLLPPLKPARGQPPYWRGNPWLRWEAEALSLAFLHANDTAMAAAFNESVSKRCTFKGSWQCQG
jgi:hypothetical protein